MTQPTTAESAHHGLTRYNQAMEKKISALTVEDIQFIVDVQARANFSHPPIVSTELVEIIKRAEAPMKVAVLADLNETRLRRLLGVDYWGFNPSSTADIPLMDKLAFLAACHYKPTQGL